MADEEENENVDAAAEEGGSKDSGGGGGSLGPLLALVVVIALGVGIAYLVKTVLTAETEEQIDDSALTEAPIDSGPIWETQKFLELGEILANVKNERGRRYVKAEVQVWYLNEDDLLMARPEVLPSLKAAVQRELRSWDINEYEQESMADKMEHQFTEAMDKVLRDMFNEPDPEKKYIQRVVLNYLVQ